MRAEVISIGDELTSGRSLDTNTQWLSRQLESLGIRVLYHTTVGDELEPIVGVFRVAISRADVVVVTGGLGPTDDDLTREALAETLGQPLVSNPAALDHIRRLFAGRGREMPPKNAVQAMLPDGSRLVPNPHGTAPGISAERVGGADRRAHIFCLPGVPAEMREMWAGSVERELRRLGAGVRVIRTRLVRCFGAGESAIEAKLPGLIRRDRYPRVGITASEATITLSVTAEGASDEECETAMGPALAAIQECLGRLVFGYDDDTLQDAVVRLLRRHGRTLATVELATEGLVIQWLRSASDAGEVILGGLVGCEESLAAQLDVPSGATAGSGGEARVEAMAQAARRRFDADYALVVGPAVESRSRAETPPPVAVALATREAVHVRAIPTAIHPALRTTYLAKTALNLLRLRLLASERRRGEGSPRSPFSPEEG